MTSSGVLAGVSSTNHTPLGEGPVDAAATANANRVLPTPPTPVRVTSRSVSTSPVIRSTSSDRPIRSVTTVGRFVGIVSTDPSGGNSPSPTWNSSWAAPRVAQAVRARGFSS